MATTAALYATTITGTPTGWANTGNVVDTNTTNEASLTGSDLGLTGTVGTVEVSGFDAYDVVPPGSTINSITVSHEQHQSATTTNHWSAIGGQANLSATVALNATASLFARSATNVTRTYSTTVTLTRADLPDLRVRHTATKGTGNGIAYLRRVWVVVNYTLEDPASAGTFALYQPDTVLGNVPGLGGAGFTLGVAFRVTGGEKWIRGVRWWGMSGQGAGLVASLWDPTSTSTGRVVAQASLPTPGGDGWLEALVDTPRELASMHEYRLSIHYPDGGPITTDGPVGDVGPIDVLNNAYAGTDAYPASTTTAQNYFITPIIGDDPDLDASLIEPGRNLLVTMT